MSDENVEKVRRGYAAFSRGDLEGTVADFAADFEYVATDAIPGQAGVFRGAEEWTNLWAGCGARSRIPEARSASSST
jgi:ketosteroid isomerase-like protein